MKHFWQAFLVLLFSVGMCLADDDNQQIAKLIKSLEGEYIVTEYHSEGLVVPPEMVKKMKIAFRIKQNVMVMSLDNVDSLKVTFTLNPTANPPTIDMHGTSMNKTKKILGIYKVDGDQLQLHYDMGGKARPVDFKTVTKNAQLVTLLRAKKDKK